MSYPIFIYISHMTCFPPKFIESTSFNIRLFILESILYLLRVVQEKVTTPPPPTEGGKNTCLRPPYDLVATILTHFPRLPTGIKYVPRSEGYNSVKITKPH